MGPKIRYVRTSDGVSIAHASVGAGPALVLMPGVPFSDVAAEWRIPVLRDALGRLAEGLRIVQYDGRGTGHSQRDVTDLSLEAMLRDLDAVVAEHGLDRFALLGFYNSCTHAIAYAARHPGRVTRLILFGGSTRGWDPMSGPGTQALLSLIERDWETFVESVAHAWLGWSAPAEDGRLAVEWLRGATTPANARATLQAASGVDVSEDARWVACPVLVLHRRDASVVPLAMSEELVARLPTGSLQLLEGTSASLFFEHVEDVVRTVVDYVSGPVDGPASSRIEPMSRPEAASHGLSPRELEVLRLIAQGETNDSIGHALGISVNTVERHVANLYRKIEARGRADATAFAVRRGIA